MCVYVCVCGGPGQTYNNTIIKNRCTPMLTPSNTLLCKRRKHE